MKNNLKKFTLKFLFIAVFSSLIFPANAQFSFSEQGLKFIKLLNWLDEHYVDTVNVDKLTESAIIELLQKLDPHSSYISKDEVNEMNEPLQGNFEGIGVTFSIFRDTVMVINPMPGGPSEKAGLKPGDRIIQINDSNVSGVGIKTDDIFSKLRGKKGSIATIKLKRKGSSELLSFKIAREKIPIHSVEAVYKTEGDFGYIRISRFSSNTISEFKSALSKLKKQKINGLIIDLSGNGGGFLDVAVNLADEFLDKEKLIVYTKGIHSEKKDYYTSGKGNFEKGHLVVIIDESSASASEIFAGAIQDWDRGVLVGRRSYGKGLVQRPFVFPDGSMVRLTIARYFTPTGRLIQKSYSNGYKEYSKDILHRINSGSLTSEEKNQFVDTIKYYTLEKKRIVYGGGGIMPDVFVPIDTTSISSYIRSILSKGILNQFVVKYIDDNRDKLSKKYKSFEIFNKEFPGKEPILVSFLEYAQTSGVKTDASLSDSTKEYLSMIIKAYISRDLWSNSEFYEIYNQTEEEYLAAVKILNNWQEYQVKLHLK